MTTIALVVAAGRGERAGGGVAKQYRSLAGRPVLAHALAPLLAHRAIDGVAVVIAGDAAADYAAATTGLDLLPPVAGGAERQRSVLNGLEAIAAHAPDRVLIHDAARPFLSPAVIDRVLAALEGAPGAVPGLPVTDTVKRVADGLVGGTVDRAGLWRVQTPQGFRFPEILAAHRAAGGTGLTDDAAVAERAGLTVAMVEGDEALFKITTAADIARAERHLAPAMETRIGHGFDVHRFGPGDRVWLCGVAVPHNAALLGHSDADVGLHALTDALLGAMAAGDIGQHFPPTDPQWRGADSAVFLAHAGTLLRAAGGAIVNLDVTLICERPKVGPHRDAMRTRIAGILGIGAGRVSVKATTTERLGFTGRREGIAAEAAATVRLPVTDA